MKDLLCLLKMLLYHKTAHQIAFNYFYFVPFCLFFELPQKGKISNSRWLRFCWLAYPWACKIAISAIAQWTTISDFVFAVRRVQLKISISRLLHIEASKLALMYLSQNFTLDLLFHCSNEQDDEVHFFKLHTHILN